MTKSLSSLFLLIAFAAPLAMAHDGAGCKFFSDEVLTRYTPTAAFQAGQGVSSQKFYSIMRKIKKTYAPVFSAHGAELVLAENRKSLKPNALAAQQNGKWWVVINRALYRHPQMTSDALTLVVCHEVGHHIGGAPKKENSWASAESQADYFGSHRCFRQVLANDDNSRYLTATKDPEILQQCEMLYSHENKNAQGLCVRAILAGKHLSYFLAEVTGQNVDPTRKDPSVAKRTVEDYPSIACRYKTYEQGALCKIDINEQVSNSDPHIGNCSRKFGNQIGTRPLCWFNPESG